MRCVYFCTMMEHFLNWSLGETIIYGFVIYNWLFVAGGIVILWILYLAIMGPSEE